MNGCQHQQKSFTIPVSDQKATQVCFDCRQPIVSAVYSINSDVLCQSCFSKRPSKIRDGCESVYMTKDGLYQFPYEFQGKTYEIRDKGQWNKFMKAHGIHDDVKQTPRKIEDIKKYKQAYKPIPAKELANDMMKRAQELGIREKIGQEIRQKIGRR